jgi:hypothetical protein
MSLNTRKPFNTRRREGKKRATVMGSECTQHTLDATPPIGRSPPC